MAIDCVSVYGFAGGFELGLEMHGFKSIAHVEEHGIEVGRAQYERNRPAVPYIDDIFVTYSGVPLIFGNPPCTGFSSIGKRMGMSDPINKCIYKFFDVAMRSKPALFVWESVTTATTQGRPLINELSERARNTGYQVYHVFTSPLLNGGCQLRRRYHMVCSRYPIEWRIPDVSHWPLDHFCSKRFISDLYDVEPDGRVNGHFEIGTDWFGYKMIQFVPQGKGFRGGVPIEVRHKYYVNRYDEPVIPGFMEIRLAEDNICPCLSSISCQAHPVKNRYLTPRERARLMGFPDDWLLETAEDGGQLCRGLTTHNASYIGEHLREALLGKQIRRPGPPEWVDLLQTMPKWLRNKTALGKERERRCEVQASTA